MEHEQSKNTKSGGKIIKTSDCIPHKFEENEVSISNTEVESDDITSKVFEDVSLKNIKCVVGLDISKLLPTSTESELETNVEKATAEKYPSISSFKVPLPPFVSLKKKNYETLPSNKVLPTYFESESNTLQKQFDVHCKEKCKILESLRYPRNIEVVIAKKPSTESLESFEDSPSHGTAKSASKPTFVKPLLQEYDKNVFKSFEYVINTEPLAETFLITDLKDRSGYQDQDENVKKYDFTVEEIPSEGKKGYQLASDRDKIDLPDFLSTVPEKAAENISNCEESPSKCSTWCVDEKGALKHVFYVKYIPRIAFKLKLPNAETEELEVSENVASTQQLQTTFGDERVYDISTTKSCDEESSDTSGESDMEDSVVDSADESLEENLNSTCPTTSRERSSPQATLKFLMRKLSLEKYRKKHISPLLHALLSPTENALRKLYKKGCIKKKSIKKKKSKSSRGKKSEVLQDESDNILRSLEPPSIQTKSSLIVHKKSPPSSPTETPKAMKISPLVPRGTILVASRVVSSPKSNEKDKKLDTSLELSAEKRISPKLRLFSEDSMTNRITLPLASETSARTTSWLTIHTTKRENIKHFFPKRPTLARSVSDESLPSSSSRLTVQPPVKKARRSLIDASSNAIVYPPDNLYERFSVGLIDPEQEVEEILFYMYTPFTPELLFSVDMVAFHAHVNRIENFYMPFGGIGAELVAESRMTVDLEDSLLGLLNMYVYMYEDTFSDILLHPKFDYTVFRKCLIDFWSKHSTSKYDIVRFMVFCTMVSTFAVNAYEQGVSKAFRFTSLLICHAIEYFKYIQKVTSLWDDLKDFVRNMKAYSKNPCNYLDK